MASVVLFHDRRILINVAKLGSSSKNDFIFNQKSYFNTTNTKHALSKDLNQLSVNYKRGTGGRSSFSGNVVTVFGCNGKIGRILLNRLGKEGFNIVAPYRGDDYLVRHLKLCADLGQINLFNYDIRDDNAIRQAVEKSSVVINCIGKDWETDNFKFEDVNIDAARRIAKISRECGVEKLIHFSALNASLNPQKIYMKKGSKYLRTKYEGELAVREEFPGAVIIRPATMYGEEDRFLYFYKDELRRNYFWINLWNRGEKTIKRPVYLPDVAAGIMKIVNDKTIAGRTFDFANNEQYLLSDIVDYIHHILQRGFIRRHNMGIYYLLLNWLYEQFPKRKFYNFDFMEREFISDVITPEHGSLNDLGVQQKRFEDVVPYHLKIYSRLGYYDQSLGEFPDPDPPKKLPKNFKLDL